MSIHDDVLSLIKTIAERTGDPNAWKAGLNADEIISVLSPVASNEQLAPILGKIRSRQTTLGSPQRSDDGQPSTASDGEAAEAVSSAERALAQQNSATSQLDLQVVSAILNAHTTAVAGRERLDSLQRDVETAVRSRSDLDTPAGARDFQRFLIGKLREIQALVATTGLEATSQSLLLAATASLYEASKKPPETSGELPASVSNADPTPVRRYLGSASPGNEIDYLPSDLTAPAPTCTALEPAPAPSTSVPSTSVPASLGSLAGPGIGTPGVPFGGSAGWGSAGGTPQSALFDHDQGGHRGHHRNDALSALVDDSDSSDKRRSDAAQDDPDLRPEAVPPDEVSVTLPDGDTISIASPPLAEVISAAIGGTPLEEAFRQQGVVIPPPGTPVVTSIDAASVTAGDIGVYTDHHVLAVGHDKVLVERQIQHIADIGGPSFLGWMHPPASVDERPQATASAQTHPTGISTGWIRSD